MSIFQLEKISGKCYFIYSLKVFVSFFFFCKTRHFAPPPSVFLFFSHEDLLGPNSSARDFTPLDAGNWKNTPVAIGRWDMLYYKAAINWLVSGTLYICSNKRGLVPTRDICVTLTYIGYIRVRLCSM